MNDYIKAHLGIEASVIKYQDVESFFQSVQAEKATLEFKSFNLNGPIDAKLRALTTSVTALLNSEGGLIIWGAPQEKKNDGIKVCQGDLTAIDQLFEKDFLISKLAGNITPLPTNIEVLILGMNSEFIYLIQVQPSLYSPHQSDNRYWMRTDAQTIPAPHHYVEALFKKIKYPDLRGTLTFKKWQYYFENKNYLDQYLIRLKLNVTLINNSPFQNEENYEFDVFSDIGKYANYNDPWPPRQKERFAPFVRQSYQLNVLHHGKQIENGIAIVVDGMDLKRTLGKVNVVLRFGGRYSPLKYSTYQINLKFFDNTKHFENHEYPMDEKDIIEETNSQLISESLVVLSKLQTWNLIKED